MVAAAAPIRDAAGRIVAALNLSAPRFRFDAAPGGGGAIRLVEAAESLSGMLRGDPLPALV